MYVKIYNPEGGEVYLLRELADDEIMDERSFADQVAHNCFDSIIEEPGGLIPSCLGDIRVEFLEDPVNDWHIYSGESFYLAADY